MSKEIDTLVAEKIMKGAKKPYSTDIFSAFEVVEAMHALPKPVLMIAAPQQDYSNEMWRATFSRKWWADDSPYDWESGETAAEAICKAALAWFD